MGLRELLEMLHLRLCPDLPAYGAGCLSQPLAIAAIELFVCLFKSEIMPEENYRNPATFKHNIISIGEMEQARAEKLNENSEKGCHHPPTRLPTWRQSRKR